MYLNLLNIFFLHCFMIFRRKRSENKSSHGRATLQLEDLGSGSTDTTSSTANLVYQNLVDIRPPEEGTVLLVLSIDYTKILVK